MARLSQGEGDLAVLLRVLVRSRRGGGRWHRVGTCGARPDQWMVSYEPSLQWQGEETTFF